MTAVSTDRPLPITRQKTASDYTAYWVALLAAVLSVGAYIYFDSLNASLSYKDAISHIEIARRVIDSPTAGFAQLGGVWLPLPHLLMVPLVWIDSMYYSGFAGSVVSMMAYVVTSMLLYKVVYNLTSSKPAGVIGALVFMANPNVLFMQATAMSEMLLFACMVGMVYGVQRWIQTDQSKYLFFAGIASLLGTCTRYEAWVLLAVLTLVVVFAAWRKRYSYHRIEGSTLAFLYVGGAGIVAWLVWNQLIFGNALNFQNGEYAKPSLWVGEGESAVGDWWIALQTYYYAVQDNLWLPVIVVALIGLVIMAVKERFALRILPTLTLLSLFPFFVIALERGQRPLHVSQLTGELYNVRFGLLMILPAAILIGYLVSIFRRSVVYRNSIASALVVLAVVFAAISFSSVDRISTFKEPTDALKTGYTQASDGASQYLRTHYVGGNILMESFGNELVLFNARISSRYNIYEGSYQLWEPALQDPPSSHIRWIVMRGTDQPDITYVRLYDTSVLLDRYDLVYHNSDYFIYKEKSA